MTEGRFITMQTVTKGGNTWWNTPLTPNTPAGVLRQKTRGCVDKIEFKTYFFTNAITNFSDQLTLSGENHLEMTLRDLFGRLAVEDFMTLQGFVKKLQSDFVLWEEIDLIRLSYLFLKSEISLLDRESLLLYTKNKDIGVIGDTLKLAGHVKKLLEDIYLTTSMHLVAEHNPTLDDILGLVNKVMLDAVINGGESFQLVDINIHHGFIRKSSTLTLSTKTFAGYGYAILPYAKGVYGL